MAFYTLGATLVLVEIFCAVHAVRRNRSQWLYFIIFVPVVGCATYIICYVLPDMKVDTAVKETGEKLVKKINPTGKLLKLKKELEYADTIVNRQALAKEYLSLGAYDDAVTLYESCLEPPYEDDPEMIFDLATALYLNKSYDEAKEQLLRLKEINLGLRQKDAYLMLAKTYEQLGEVDNALAEYKSLVPVYPGEEARCRYALLLKKNGKPKAAKKMFNEIILGANRSPRYYKRNQRKWINMAKENLREPQQ